MAEDIKYDNLASSIYNNSAGYMPKVSLSPLGVPRSPSDARWFGVAKQFININFANGLDGDPTGNHEKSYLFNNYAESIVSGAKTLVELDGTTATVKLFPDVEPIFECVSYGWGELRENYGSPDIIAPDVNPTTVAAKRALVNGIMSMFANEQFYLYMLQKGYIYKDIKPLDDKLPKFFIENIKELVDADFDIPSRYVEQIQYSISKTEVVEGGIPPFDEKYLGSETVIRDIIHPDDNPSYGTEYDPSSTLAKEYQPNAASFYGTGFNENVSIQDELFKPQDQNSQKPSFIKKWSAIFSKDEATEATDNQTGDPYSATAPVYEGNIKINADMFIDNLVNANIVQFDVEGAIGQLYGFVNPAPRFNTGTGATSLFASGVVIPGVSNDGPTAHPSDITLVTAINDQEIAKKLADSLATVESVFKIGTIHPGATHYINDLAKKEIEGGTVENKTLFASFVQDKNVKIQRYPLYNDDPKTTALTLEHGSTIKVVKEFIVRGKGKYHKVEVVNPNTKYFGSKAPLYIRSDLLTKLDGQLPSLPRLFLEYEPAKKPIDWFKMDDETIFFDNYYKAYSVVVEPLDPNTGKKITSLSGQSCDFKVKDLEPSVIKHGIEVLMRCYDKSKLFKEDDNLSESLVYLTTGVFQFAYSRPSSGTHPNWYLGTRPDSKLRMIVRIPAKYFDAMEINAASFDLSAPETISLLTCNLSHKVKKATEVMRVHHQQIQKWDGAIEYLDLEQEIKRLEAFPFAIQKFIEDNGYTFDLEAEDEIEIGIIPNDYSLLYVEYMSAGRPVRMKRCLNRFIMSSPVKYARTIAYLYFLDEIVELGKSSTSKPNGWYTLVNEYTYPQPSIKSNPVSDDGYTEKTADGIADKLDLVDVLTSVSKLAQDQEISLPELKLKLASLRIKQKDFIGDPFVGSIPSLMDLIGSLPRNKTGLLETFSLVFDKIDLPTLSSLGSESLMNNMSFGDMQTSFALASLDSPEFGELKLGNFLSSLSGISLGKINLGEQFMNGEVGIEDLSDFDSDTLDKLLSYFDNIKLQFPTNNKPSPSQSNFNKLKQLPADDAKCLTEKKAERFPTNKNSLSRESGQKVDLIKIILSAKELLDGIQLSAPEIFDGISSLSGGGGITTPSPGSLSLNIPAVKMPKPPTLSLPSLKIDDTMAGVSQELTTGLEEILATVFIEIISSLLQSVYDSIFSVSTDITTIGTDGLPIEYGGENINNLITNSDNANRIFKSFGIPDDVFMKNEPREIISKISEVITPIEVISLLEGTATRDTIKAVENKMSEIDPQLLISIDRNSSTKDLFSGLGKLADPTVLENIKEISTRILPNVSGLICEDEDESQSANDTARREALGDKLDEDCIDTQVKNENRINREKLAELLSYANGADPLDGRIPSPIDNCGATAKANSNNISVPTSGLINKNHPTIDYLNDKVIKAVFDPIKMNFSAEANSIVDVYSESKFRYPTEDEDNYRVLEQKLDMNGLSAGNITDGIAGSLGDNQPKFEDIAAPLRRLDTKIAPKIKKQLETKTTSLIDQQTEGETNKQFKFATIAEELSASFQQKKLVTVEKEFPFYHYSRPYPSEATQFPLGDNWVFTFENGTAKGILDNLIHGSEDNAIATFLGRKEIPQEVSELSSGYTFYPHIRERDQIFANYMKQQWEQVDSSFVVDFDKNSGVNFFTFFREKRPLYFKSLVNLIGAQISTSNLFTAEGLADLELGENMQFSQNKCDNLLALENLKEEAKKQYNNTCDDNNSSSAPGALEESNLVNLMRAAIRVSIIQMTSEAIFLFSKLGFEKSIQDPAAAQFLLNYVIADLQTQDKEFYDEFINQAEISIEKRKKGGEKLIDPFENSDEIDPLIESPDDGMDRINYLQYMIKEEIKKLGPLIDKKLMTPAIDINDLFLDTIVPSIDVPRHKDENRFEVLVDSALGGKASQPKQEFKFLSKSNSLFDGSGGFVLERYIRVEDSLDITDISEGLNEDEKAFATAWFARPGGKNNETVDATYLESIKLDNDLASELDFAHTSGAVNKGALLQVITKISQQADIDPKLVDFSKFVKNFQYGLRLVYIPPTNKNSFMITETASGNAGILDVLGLDSEDAQNIIYENLIITNDEITTAKNAAEDSVWGAILSMASFEGVLHNSITTPNLDDLAAKETILLDIARREKAYSLTETLGSFKTVEEEEEATFSATTTNIYPVPVVTIERDLGILDAIKNDDGIATLDRVSSSLNSQTVTNAAYSALKSEMKKSKEYKFLFGYNIPLKRVATSLMIYNVVASVKNYPEIKKAYNETKNLIRSNFFNMLPGDPWWSKQDKRIEEAGGNAGLMANANNSMTTSGPSGNAMAAKIAAKALVILLKAYAEKSDPHYGLMKQLDNFGLTIDGMTWGSVPALYPVNFPLPVPPFVGWGPPMTPTGMLAYSLPLLPGEVQQRKKRKKEQGQQIDDHSCEDNKSE